MSGGVIIKDDPSENREINGATHLENDRITGLGDESNVITKMAYTGLFYSGSTVCVCVCVCVCVGGGGGGGGGVCVRVLWEFNQQYFFNDSISNLLRIIISAIDQGNLSCYGRATYIVYSSLRFNQRHLEYI